MAKFKLLGLSDEDRLAIEEASQGTVKTETAQVIVNAAVKAVEKQAQALIDTSIREIQSVIGPHGSVSRLQAGGIRIAPGQGIGVYESGVLKTTILPDGNLRVGSDIKEPSTTTFCCFVNEQVYNSEVMDAGDLLIGDNTTAQSNVKFDASDGQLQFRYGQTVKAYMDTDGSIKAGEGDITLDNTGVFIKNNEYSAFSFGDASNNRNLIFMASSLSNSLVISNLVPGGNAGILWQLKLADNSTPVMWWKESTDDASVAQLDIATGPSGVNLVARSTVTTQAFSIWGGKDGKETIFNEDSFDIDFRIEGATDASLFKADAGLDGIGIGGAAESGYKLKVTGDMKITGNITGNIYLIPWGVFVNINPMSADGAPYATSLHKTITFVKWSQTVHVSTTNNGTNYWKIKIVKNDGTVIKEINTSAIAADTWTRLEATTFDVATAGTADTGLQVNTVKVGAPGVLYTAGPILEVT